MAISSKSAAQLREWTQSLVDVPALHKTKVLAALEANEVDGATLMAISTTVEEMEEQLGVKKLFLVKFFDNLVAAKAAEAAPAPAAHQKEGVSSEPPPQPVVQQVAQPPPVINKEPEPVASNAPPTPEIQAAPVQDQSDAKQEGASQTPQANEQSQPARRPRNRRHGKGGQNAEADQASQGQGQSGQNVKRQPNRSRRPRRRPGPRNRGDDRQFPHFPNQFVGPYPPPQYQQPYMQQYPQQFPPPIHHYPIGPQYPNQFPYQPTQDYPPHPMGPPFHHQPHQHQHPRDRDRDRGRDRPRRRPRGPRRPGGREKRLTEEERLAKFLEENSKGLESAKTATADAAEGEEKVDQGQKFAVTFTARQRQLKYTKAAFTMESTIADLKIYLADCEGGYNADTLVIHHRGKEKMSEDTFKSLECSIGEMHFTVFHRLNGGEEECV